MLKLLKNATKALVSPLLDATGIYDRRIERAGRAAGSWTIVMYHRVIVDPACDPFELGMCVTRDRFEQQVRYLRDHFQVLAVSDVLGRCARGEPLPPRSLSITFDDGYLDNLTLALPVLQRHGLPFSVFVPTGGLAEGRMLWWDRVIAAIGGTRRSEVDLQELGLSDRTDVRPLQGVQAALHVEDILNRLWSLPPAACEQSVDRIERWLAPERRPALQAARLTVEQVRELHRHGVEIGAHSVSHPNLALAAPQQVVDELHRGREQLQTWLQSEVRGFAYPGGHFDDTTQQAVASAGYAYALSTETGLNLPPYNPHRLLRIGMPDSDLSDFRRAFSGAMLRGIPDGHVQF
jgi:peptidoglycan/xylan/chitin deacetylase (PgdA/CDA1 family)